MRKLSWRSERPTSGERGGTITSDGLSKWAGAGGWRLGFFAFPKSLSWLKDAMAAAANGFCFFNNACIAANHLRRRWDKVALLDVDVHTGNGSLDILYERGDIFFASLHPDPAHFPTFFLGHADETGAGPGAGTCLNVLLPMGAGEDEVMAGLDRALGAIRAFGAEALVVSLGFDMAADDPLAAVQLRAGGFARMARAITALDLPTALIQEGGYLGPSLAANAAAFLDACRDRPPLPGGRAAANRSATIRASPTASRTAACSSPTGPNQFCRPIE